MIAHWPLARVNRFRIALRPPPTAASPPPPPRCFQVALYTRNSTCVLKFGGKRSGSNEMGHHKKLKTAMLVWKPLSTEAALKEEAQNLAADDQHFTSNEPNLGVGETSASVASAIESVNGSEAVEGQVTSASCHLGDVAKSSDSQSDVSIPPNVVLKETLVEMDCNSEIAGRKAEKYSVSIEVDASLIRFVKGKGGSMQKQIEGDTGAKIIFPSSKDDASVVIEGSTVEIVTKASEKISTVLEEAVKSPQLDYSHFISLPLAVHPDLVRKLLRFQSTILGDAICSLDTEGDSNEDTSDEMDYKNEQSESSSVSVKLDARDGELVRVKLSASDSKQIAKASNLSDLGIDKSIFIKPKTFHLTVLMLKLWNKDRIAAASEVLQGLSSKVKDALENRPISINLRGLTCMRGSPAKARVVYAPVVEVGSEGRLLRACQVIIDAFIESGLVLDKDAKSTLKLHATVMNVRHRKRNRWTKRNDFFDARHILKVYGSEEWGDYPIREVHLSQRFKFDESGYYHCCSSIALPEKMQTE